MLLHIYNNVHFRKVLYFTRATYCADLIRCNKVCVHYPPLSLIVYCVSKFSAKLPCFSYFITFLLLFTISSTLGSLSNT